MKHAITSLEYLLRMKGFSHGAGGQSFDLMHGDSKDYDTGFVLGRQMRKGYSDAVCEELNLENPEVHAASLG